MGLLFTKFWSLLFSNTGKKFHLTPHVGFRIIYTVRIQSDNSGIGQCWKDDNIISIVSNVTDSECVFDVGRNDVMFIIVV